MNSNPHVRWVRLALVYFLVAVALGVAMAASHDHRLRGVHVHLNLLGWVSMAITGWIYQQFPAAAANRWAHLHFWLYQLGLPAMMGALAGLLLGHPAFEPAVAVSSIVVLAAIAIFVVNVLVHSGARSIAARAPRAGVPAYALDA